MAVASDEATSICSHCDRAIPSSNIDLHFAHCSRNLEKCKTCGDMVPRKFAEEHFLSTHAPVSCSLCSETMDREVLAVHKGENCPQRIVTCEFCEFPLPAIDLLEHQEVCGNRTELCNLCNRYIRLRERLGHESRCTGVADNIAESSRATRPVERDRGPQRRQPNEFSGKRLLFTIAVTGIAVLIEVRKHKEGIGSMAPVGVRLSIQDRYVVMDNGMLQVTLSKPDGIITGIRYNGLDNLLEVLNDETNRGYWDIVWNADGSGKAGIFEVIKATEFKVIKETEEQVELSFLRPWDTSLQGKLAPINIDKRFIVLRGCSGFYSYAIYEHIGSMDWPAFSLGETRIAFKLRKDKFHYMAVSDNRQRFMPLPDDRLTGRGQPLAYPEAVLLVNPVEPEFRGEVDDKYQYSCDNKDLKVHGWISMDPPVGFWQITPSDEFRSGGPMKQNLSSHVGPTTLAMFLSAHYAGDDLVPKFEQGEPWKKVFGPVFLYLNSVMGEEDPLTLWDDAKIQMLREVESWPYSFPASEDFPSCDQRGNVRGRLLVKDRYINSDYILATGAYVGLAPPGQAGSWQRECKDYQFWTNADEGGYFSLNNVRSGDYNLYAWVPGFVGDYWNEALITMTPGCDMDIGEIVYEPPRDGPTLWEIGFPDRSASEFYVPDPNPKYINKVLLNGPERFRQYGLWERYSEIYSKGDLVYTVGESDYRKDWFYAQVIRKKEGNTFQGTTWQIKFKLDDVNEGGIYKLRIALASASFAELQVRINNPNTNRPLFSSGLIGRDNSIARHGIHGLYWLYNLDIQGIKFLDGFS